MTFLRIKLSNAWKEKKTENSVYSGNMKSINYIITTLKVRKNIVGSDIIKRYSVIKREL